MAATVVQAQVESNPLDNLEEEDKQQKQQTPTPPAGERPTWLPEKFKTPEDMATAYANLEKEFTKRNQPTPPKSPTPPNPPTPPASPEGKVDVNALWDEYSTKGKISDETYALLDQRGIPKEMVNGFIDHAVQTAQADQNKIYERAGDKASYDAMIAWAGVNLSAAEIDAFDATVSTGSMDAALLAVDGLKARYEKDVGKDPKNLLLGGDGVPKGTAGYRSRSEMIADMKNPKYASDPAFRKDVEDKVRASTIF